MPALTIIEASTSGHTTFVLDEVTKVLAEKYPTITVKRLRAEVTKAADLEDADALVFGSGTWNTGGVEGQLNPYMHELLFERLSSTTVKKPMAFISLGDDRYYFTTRCTERFLKFQRDAEGTALLTPLIIVNEPYDQIERIVSWAERLGKVVEKIS